MSDQKRCPVSTCSASTNHTLMCDACWRTVPSEERNAVSYWYAQRFYAEKRDGALVSDSYVNACRIAIETASRIRLGADRVSAKRTDQATSVFATRHDHQQIVERHDRERLEQNLNDLSRRNDILEQLAALVKRYRGARREFEKTGSSGALRSVVSLEPEIDQLLKQLDQRNSRRLF